MKINIVIVDDSSKDISTIKTITAGIFYATDYAISIDSFENADDPLLFAKKYNVYILDVDMKGSLTLGFDLSKTIYDRYPDATVMFCSNHDYLVFDSFKLNAFYFVRKGENLESDLKGAFSKYIRSACSRFYIAKNKNGSYRINLDQVVYFEAGHNNLFVSLINGDEIRERKKLSAVYDEVKKKGFIAVGKSFVVNLKFITSVNKEMRLIILTNNQKIPMSATQSSEIERLFREYNEE